MHLTPTWVACIYFYFYSNKVNKYAGYKPILGKIYLSH